MYIGWKFLFSSFESKVIQRLQPELDPLTQCSRRLQSLKKKDFSANPEMCCSPKGDCIVCTASTYAQYWRPLTAAVCLWRKLPIPQSCAAPLCCTINASEQKYKHRQRHNEPKALSTLTHSTTLFQSKSFNMCRHHGQTLVWYCLKKGEKNIQ